MQRSTLATSLNEGGFLANSCFSVFLDIGKLMAYIFQFSRGLDVIGSLFLTFFMRAYTFSLVEHWSEWFSLEGILIIFYFTLNKICIRWYALWTQFSSKLGLGNLEPIMWPVCMTIKCVICNRTKLLSKLVWRETLQTLHISLYWVWILKI